MREVWRRGINPEEPAYKRTILLVRPFRPERRVRLNTLKSSLLTTLGSRENFTVSGPTTGHW